jgi:hypothetical protein
MFIYTVHRTHEEVLRLFIAVILNQAAANAIAECP